MAYPTFLAYNLLGAAVWVSSLVYAGYLFGNIPWVKDNLVFIVIGIVFVSLVPDRSCSGYASGESPPAASARGRCR